MRKYAKHCDGCAEKKSARYRTLADQFYCDACYAIWLTGEDPTPQVSEARWGTR